MTELEQNIQSYFGVVKNEDLQAISSFFHLNTLKKGEYFLKEGKPCEQLSFIRSGVLRIFKTHDGKEVTQWLSVKGTFVTDLASLFFEGSARWTIQCLSDCELYTISRENYKQIGTVVPKWHELEKLFLIKCFTFMEDRIHGFLSLPAEERYNVFFENNRELFNQVPLQYIASMLGMTPETLSRLRNKQVKNS
ncbi:MAG: Crp/Fnr family transcriptional regulator [Bacteroidia bacterium]|nr:Crp/Fnr family transcriptional regulator [Bacteroidia bacterium]